VSHSFLSFALDAADGASARDRAACVRGSGVVAYVELFESSSRDDS